MHRVLFITGLTIVCLMLGLRNGIADEKKAIAAIAKLGGKIKRDEKHSAKPVVYVDLTSGRTTQIKGHDVAHLKAFKHLRVLYLSYTDVTDEALTPLQGLKNLEELHLAETKITDKGLTHLAGLKKIKKLGFPFTRVTDKGLNHLKGLKNLEMLNVASTQVTAKGVVALQKALPKVYVIR